MCKRVRRWVGVLALAAASAHAAPGDATSLALDDQAWVNLKGRLALGTATPFRNDFSGIDTDPPRVSSLSLMGDYYLSRPWLGTSGGLRATSGLLLGSRTSLWSSPVSVDRRTGPAAGFDSAESGSTLPYLGMGYTGLSSKGGWGLSADVGLMATQRSGVHLGKLFNGTQSFDDTMRDLRFSPLLQLGLSYSF